MWTLPTPQAFLGPLDLIENCLIQFAFANRDVCHPIFKVGVEIQKLEDINMNIVSLL
jgi:hypothetical protein